MAKFKLDSKQLKELLFSKGEVVGLGVAALLLVLFFGMAVMAVLSSRSPAPTIAKDAEAIRMKIEGSEPPPLTSVRAKEPEWVSPLKSYDKWVSAHWFDNSGTATNKREKPILLAVNEPFTGEKRNMQLDYVIRGVRVYEVDRKKQLLTVYKSDDKGPEGQPKKGPEGGASQNVSPVYSLRPTRMVIVSATFPYKLQVENFKKALRIGAEKDLFDKNLQPQFRGINVLRAVTLPGQSPKDATWEPLYTFVEGEKRDRVEAAKHIKDFLEEAVIDEDNITQLKANLAPNAATPLLELTSGDYPEPKLAGITPLPLSDGRKEGPGGIVRPKGMGDSGVGNKFGKRKQPGELGGDQGDKRATERVKFKDLPEKLQDQFTGNMNVVSPDGVYEEPPEPVKDTDSTKDENKNKGNAFQPGGKRRKYGDSGRPQGATGGANKDANNGYAFNEGYPENGRALIRFIDVGVQPGATYQYKIQVVFANPNYKQDELVTHPDVSASKVLVDKDRFTETPPITIPREYQFYVFDQTDPDQIGKTDAKKLATYLRREGNSVDYKEFTSDKAPVQIHQWVGVAQDPVDPRTTYTIADWVIAERVLVQRGDKIGRDKRGIEVEVPVWNPNLNGDRGGFEIGTGYIDPKAKVKKVRYDIVPVGVPVNFLQRKADEDEDDLAPVVVDFEGGRRGVRQYKGRLDDFGTNSSLEMMLLGPDGKLTVRNSRDDRNADTVPGTHAFERRERYTVWADRLYKVRTASFPPPDKKDGPGGKKGGG